MSEDTEGTDAASPWAAQDPSQEVPWDRRRVVHLHRRAGFAATWGEIQRDLKDGPKAAVDRLLAGTSASATPAEFTSTADLLAAAAEPPADTARPQPRAP